MNAVLLSLTFVLDLQVLRLHHLLHQPLPGLPLQPALLLSFSPDLLQLLLDQVLHLLLLFPLSLQLLEQILPVPALLLTQLLLNAHIHTDTQASTR